MIIFQHSSAYLSPKKQGGETLYQLSRSRDGSEPEGVLVSSTDSWTPVTELDSNIQHGEVELGIWKDKNGNNQVDKGEVKTVGDHLKLRKHAFTGAEVVVGDSDTLLHTVHAPKNADAAEIEEAVKEPNLWVAQGEGLNFDAHLGILPPSEQADTLITNAVYGEVLGDVPPVTSDMTEAYKLVDYLRDQEFRHERHWEHDGKEHVMVKEGSFTDIRMNGSKKKTKVNLTTEANTHSVEADAENMAFAIATVAAKAGRTVKR